MNKWIGLLLLLTFLDGSPGAYGDNINPGAISVPNDIAVDVSGNLYITDFYSNLYKMTPEGVVTNLVGLSHRPIIGGIAVDPSGDVYVADVYNNVIWKTTPGGVWSILAGSTGVAGSANGAGTAASFKGPTGLAVDKSGNVYVADEQNNLVRKITQGGVVTTLAGGGTGSGVVGGAVDGKGTAASFSSPYAVAVDKAGNVFVADLANQLIRKITPGGVVTTLAGSAGKYGSTNGAGTAALFSGPNGIAVDKTGNVYVADYGNNLIRKITSWGVVTTLAGALGAKTNGGWNNSEIFVGGFADGTGTSALFFNPFGVAVDGSGNVYVADKGNNSVRKITTQGVVTTLAGSRPGAGASGTASAGTAAPAGNGNAPANPSASSGPITLVCTPATGKGDPAQLILNEAARTADFGSDAVTTATFNDTTVWWEVDTQDPNYQITYEHQYNLSRLTGVLTLSNVRGTTDTNGNTKWAREMAIGYNCKVGVEKRLF